MHCLPVVQRNTVVQWVHVSSILARHTMMEPNHLVCMHMMCVHVALTWLSLMCPRSPAPLQTWRGTGSHPHALPGLH